MISHIWHYVGEMLVLAVPAAVVFSCFWPYRRRSLEAMGLHTNPWRETALILFVMALFGVLSVTLWPVYLVRNQGGVWGDILLLTERPSLWSNLNLVPFRMFADYWRTIAEGDILFTIINFCGNLAVFVPLGFFPALLWRGETWRRSALVGFGTSFFVEAGQYFIMRSTDIDDVILNTLGALCGYWMYRLLNRLAPKITEKFKCVKVESFRGGTSGDQDLAPGAGAGEL